MKIINHDASKRFTEVLNINLVYLCLLGEKKSRAVRFVVIMLASIWLKQLCIKIFLFSRSDLTSCIEVTAQYFWYVSNARGNLGYSNNLKFRCSTIYVI